MAHKNSIKLHRKDHEPTHASSLSTLWKNEAFIDLTIVCDDDHIAAHKLILSSSSPVFERILSINSNPSSQSVLYLKGTKKSDLEHLLDFIYSGETNFAQDDLQRFIDLAVTFEIKGLSVENNLIGDETDENTSEEVNWKKSNLPDQHEMTHKNKLISPEMVTAEETINAQVKSNEENAGSEQNFKELNETGSSECDKRITQLLNKTDKSWSFWKESNLLAPDTNEKTCENVLISPKMITIEKTINAQMESEQINAGMKNCTNYEERYEEGIDDISIAEYDRRISQLMNKSSNGCWSCNKCSYVSGNNNSHMKDHVGQHIEGITFKCNLCKKTSKSRSSLRRHKWCKGQAWSVIGSANIMGN